MGVYALQAGTAYLLFDEAKTSHIHREALKSKTPMKLHLLTFSQPDLHEQ